jgi:glycosyltransferase involved in cell wall biosynthesis
MVPHNPLVAIFIPTYKNYHLIYSSIESCLKQTYTNIKIVVVDNGFSEEPETLRRKIESYSDKRIIYLKNTVNIGSQNNFHLVLELARAEEYSIIIPADVDLAANAVEVYLNAKQSNIDIAIFFGRTVARDIRLKNMPINSANVENPLPWPKGNRGRVSTKSLIRQFFSSHNLTSEWTHFTFIGALIDGNYLRSIGLNRYPMFDHGLEEHLTLYILSFSDYVYLLDDIVINLYTNNVRLGTAARPSGFFTRYEPLFAEIKYLRDFEPLFLRHDFPIVRMYVATLWKLLFTLIRYPGPSLALIPNIPILILKIPLFLLNNIFKVIRQIVARLS